MTALELLKDNVSSAPAPDGQAGDESGWQARLAVAVGGMASGMENAAASVSEWASAAQSRIALLEAVAENFPGGIALFDRELAMVFCNAKLRQLLDYPDALFATGRPSMETLFRCNAQRGEDGAVDVNESVSEKKALPAERRAHHYQPRPPYCTLLQVGC
jgi:PAS domain-containing protein